LKFGLGQLFKSIGWKPEDNFLKFTLKIYYTNEGIVDTNDVIGHV